MPTLSLMWSPRKARAWRAHTASPWRLLWRLSGGLSTPEVVDMRVRVRQLALTMTTLTTLAAMAGCTGSPGGPRVATGDGSRVQEGVQPVADDEQRRRQFMTC